MAMDWIKRQYRSQMILYEGGPPVWGQWTPVPDDRPWIPVPSVFGSRTWDPWPTHLADPVVGEQRSSSRLARPRRLNPRFTGLSYCGSAQIWAGGATLADVGTPEVDYDGVPECCEGLAIEGGTESGGAGSSWPVGTVGLCASVSPQLRVTLTDLPGGTYFPPGGVVGLLLRDWPFQSYSGVVVPPDGVPVYVAWAPSVPPTSVLSVYRAGDVPPVPGPVGYSCGPLRVGPVGYADAPSYPLGIEVLIEDAGPPEGYVDTPVVAVDFEVQTQALALRARLDDNGFLQPYEVGLYQFDLIQRHNLVMGSLVECTFPGYARIPLTPPGVLTNNGAGLYTVAYPTVLFACTASFEGQQVAGWFVSNPATNRLHFIRRLPGGVQIVQGGVTVPVVPVVQLRSQYVEL